MLKTIYLRPNNLIRRRRGFYMNFFIFLNNIFKSFSFRFIEPSNASTTKAVRAPKIRKEGAATHDLRGAGFRDEAG